MANRFSDYPATAGYNHSAAFPDDPAKYTVRPYVVDGVIAGRKVRLQLHPQPDMTPGEAVAIWPLLQHRVEGNRLAYLIDSGLVRHFEEVGFPAEDIGQSEDAGAVPSIYAHRSHPDPLYAADPAGGVYRGATVIAGEMAGLSGQPGERAAAMHEQLRQEVAAQVAAAEDARTIGVLVGEDPAGDGRQVLGYVAKADG